MKLKGVFIMKKNYHTITSLEPFYQTEKYLPFHATNIAVFHSDLFRNLRTVIILDRLFFLGEDVRKLMNFSDFSRFNHLEKGEMREEYVAMRGMPVKKIFISYYGFLETYRNYLHHHPEIIKEKEGIDLLRSLCLEEKRNLDRDDVKQYPVVNSESFQTLLSSYPRLNEITLFHSTNFKSMTVYTIHDHRNLPLMVVNLETIKRNLDLPHIENYSLYRYLTIYTIKTSWSVMEAISFYDLMRIISSVPNYTDSKKRKKLDKRKMILDEIYELLYQDSFHIGEINTTKIQEEGILLTIGKIQKYNKRVFPATLPMFKSNKYSSISVYLENRNIWLSWNDISNYLNLNYQSRSYAKTYFSSKEDFICRSLYDRTNTIKNFTLISYATFLRILVYYRRKSAPYQIHEELTNYLFDH